MVKSFKRPRSTGKTTSCILAAIEDTSESRRGLQSAQTLDSGPCGTPYLSVNVSTEGPSTHESNLKNGHQRQDKVG